MGRSLRIKHSLVPLGLLTGVVVGLIILISHSSYYSKSKEPALFVFDQEGQATVFKSAYKYRKELDSSIAFRLNFFDSADGKRVKFLNGETGKEIALNEETIDYKEPKFGIAKSFPPFQIMMKKEKVLPQDKTDLKWTVLQAKTFYPEGKEINGKKIRDSDIVVNGDNDLEKSVKAVFTEMKQKTKK